ncbi:hypothetical protein SynRCC2555_02468 [Synechococcus sp. WH 8101]|nr:hypothetical protein SynRCC2555_02468 [Synechococcus sp. WH 8101]
MTMEGAWLLVGVIGAGRRGTQSFQARTCLVLPGGVAHEAGTLLS